MLGKRGARWETFRHMESELKPCHAGGATRGATGGDTGGQQAQDRTQDVWEMASGVRPGHGHSQIRVQGSQSWEEGGLQKSSEVLSRAHNDTSRNNPLATHY